jgi:hypothetical protein
MSVLGSLIDGAAIAVPEIMGEFVTGLFLRGGRGRWERIALGDRKRAEREVRFLRRNHVSAWVRPAPSSAYEIVVRTAQADIARALLNAPGSGLPS